MNKNRVLIVDDVLTDALTLKKIVEQAGEFEIHIHNIEEDLLASLKNNEFHFVFMDYYLGNYNASDVLLSLARDNAFGNTKFIIITSDDNPSLLLRTIKLGAHHFILKPILLSRVKQALNVLSEEPEGHS